jgi:hypothetical protein
MLILASILLIAGACVDLINLGCVVASYRLRHRGIDRHVSPIPLVAPLLVLVAAIAAYAASARVLPPWLFWLVALADISLLSLLHYPIFLLRKRLRG